MNKNSLTHDIAITIGTSILATAVAYGVALVNNESLHGNKIVQSAELIENRVLHDKENRYSDFEWDGTEITGINTTDKFIVIPSYCTAIRNKAFENSDIYGVYIGDNVKSVGMLAFSNCEKLEYVYMGDGVELIDTNAFAECINLEKVRLSSGLEKINTGGFRDCLALKELENTENLELVACANYSFSECDRLDKKSLSFIDNIDGAFSYFGLTRF